MSDRLNNQLLHCMPNLKRANGSKKSHGFTLIELMVTILLLGVIITLAVPSLNAFLQNQRISTTSQVISNIFSTARSEALNRVSNIDVCWSPIGTAANVVRSFNVPIGQMVVLTADNPAIEIARAEYDSANLAILHTEGANPCVRYTAQGRLNPDSLADPLVPLVFRVCLPNGGIRNAESVSVQFAGRPIVLDNVASCT